MTEATVVATEVLLVVVRAAREKWEVLVLGGTEQERRVAWVE